MSNFYDFIKRRQRAYHLKCVKKKLFFEKAPASYSQYQKIKKFLPYVKGHLLDMGAGQMPYRSTLKKRCRSYLSLDVEKTHPKIDIVADARKTPFEDSSFDTIFCSQVLEHIAEPTEALKESSRILKRNGHLVISFPFAFILHNLPNDYFRYSEFGIKELLNKSSFQIKEISSYSSIISLNLYFLNSFFFTMIFDIPIIFQLFFLLNYPTNRLVYFIEEKFGLKKIFPLGYVVVAKNLKKEESTVINSLH